MFISKIKTHTSDKPVIGWQLALDGVYEEAHQVSLDLSAKDLDALKKWVLSASSNLAIEAFFGDREQDFFFFGLKLNSMEKSQQAEFVVNLVSKVSHSSNFMQFIALLQKELGDELLLQDPPHLMEIGADIYWKSHGSYVVWEHNKKSEASIDEIKEYAPQLIKPFKTMIMMELAWLNPLPMWLALPVSHRQDDKTFVFSKEKYQNVLQIGIS